MRLEGWHLIIIIVIAVLLFGAPKLPGLARSVGQSLRIFKSEMKQMKDDGSDADDDSKPSPPPAQVIDSSVTNPSARAADTAPPVDTHRTATPEGGQGSESATPPSTSSRPL
ncbi:Sec-independent protein translocase subunit TatA [Arthrobacter sp. CAN_C5]|uniref:Sec-independent protein translocase subunit TatA n=1 Tax=Arthrobacter sp. CAN_C5 TaxID=2760706 RepID=UPI001AE93DDA|nr:Sec-independent protein translocase subunit TatA [Arthrobacter sp. CAN_C5]MBP2215067.1 sec-independent protein translocase protein TatA [Arthrobacter sp. CAN_C5]